MVKLPIYLDQPRHDARRSARTGSDAVPFFCEQYGNAASRQHIFGQKAEAAVDRAREQVADLIGAEARTIVLHQRRHGEQ